MTAANDRRSTRRRVLAICSIILEQPLDIFELFLRAQRIAETAPQLFDDAAGGRPPDLSPPPHAEIVGGAPGRRGAEPPVRTRAVTLSHLLLHRLRQPLRTLAQGVERAALRIDRTVGIAIAQLRLGVAHGVVGLSELIHAVAGFAFFALLALTILAEAAVLELIEQLLEPIA